MIAFKTLTQKLLSILRLRIVSIPKYSNPIAPFDLLDIIIERELLKRGKDFYFIHLGYSDPDLCMSMKIAVSKYGLQGLIVLYENLYQNIVNKNQNEVSHTDFHKIQRDHTPQLLSKSLIAELNSKKISLLSLRDSIYNNLLIEEFFAAMLYPTIIKLERSEVNSEQILSLRMTLLDNGYRYIDIGVDSIFLRISCD